MTSCRSQTRTQLPRGCVSDLLGHRSAAYRDCVQTQTRTVPIRSEPSEISLSLTALACPRVLLPLNERSTSLSNAFSEELTQRRNGTSGRNGMQCLGTIHTLVNEGTTNRTSENPDQTSAGTIQRGSQATQAPQACTKCQPRLPTVIHESPGELNTIRACSVSASEKD